MAWLDDALARARAEHPDMGGAIDNWMSQNQGQTINGSPLMSTSVSTGSSGWNVPSPQNSSLAVQPGRVTLPNVVGQNQPWQNPGIAGPGDGAMGGPMGTGQGMADNGGGQLQAQGPAGGMGTAGFSQQMPGSGPAGGGGWSPQMSAQGPAGGQSSAGGGGGPLSDEAFAQKIREQETARWGAGNPKVEEQVQYFLNKRHDPNESSHWATGEPGRTMDDYWLMRSNVGYDPFKGPEAGDLPGGGGGMSGGTLGGLANGSLLQGFGQSFSGTPAYQAPSAEDVMNSPAVQARLKLGQEALQRSAAAKGTLLTGGALKDLNQFAQDIGSQEYAAEDARRFRNNADAFGRDVTGYTLNRDTNWGDSDRQFNRLATFTGLGQSAAGQLGGYTSGYGSASGANAGNYGSSMGANNAGYGSTMAGAGQGYGALSGANASNAGNLIVGQGNANAAGTIAGSNANSAMWNQVGGTLADLTKKKPAQQSGAGSVNV